MEETGAERVCWGGGGRRVVGRIIKGVVDKKKEGEREKTREKREKNERKNEEKNVGEDRFVLAVGDEWSGL